MSKREEFNSALKEAMKSKNKTALATIRLITAALKDRDIAARGKGKADGLNDDEILSMLQTMVKQRRESIKMYKDGGRDDLAVQEQQEIDVIETFLPQQMSDDEIASTIESLIEELGAQDIKDMGKVMGALKSRFAGQVDMGKAGPMVKDKLG